MEDQHSGRERVLWSIGILFVLLFALIPVIWILSLSFKDPATITDTRFLPSDWTLENYKSLFEGGIADSPFIGLENVCRLKYQPPS